MGSIPIEGMRVGGLPAGYRPATANDRMRAMAQDGILERNDITEAYPPLRTCRCGTEVLRGGQADADHLAGCGKPDPEPEPEFTVVIPEDACRACGGPVNAGAAYCSHRCVRLRTPENFRASQAERASRRADRRANRTRG